MICCSAGYAQNVLPTRRILRGTWLRFTKKKTLNCVFCEARFTRLHARDSHVINVHAPRPSISGNDQVYGIEPTSTTPNSSSWDSGTRYHAQYKLPLSDPVEIELGCLQNEPEGIQLLMRRFWTTIRTQYTLNPLINVYNFRAEEFTLDELIQHLRQIFCHQNGSYKLNLSSGIILRATDTGKHRYWHPNVNEELFDEPFLVWDSVSLQKLIDDILEMDINSSILANR